MKVNITTSLLLIAFFITVLGYSTTAQATKLDEKRGFKEFTLGDPISKWRSKISYSREGAEGGSLYLYEGDCCQRVFSYYAESIELQFTEDELSHIIINLAYWDKPFTENDYTDIDNCFQELENLTNKFTLLFGPPQTKEANQETGSVSHIWHGQDVYLGVLMSYEGISSGCKPTVVLIDMSIFKDAVNNGF